MRFRSIEQVGMRSMIRQYSQRQATFDDYLACPTVKAAKALLLLKSGRLPLPRNAILRVWSYSN